MLVLSCLKALMQSTTLILNMKHISSVSPELVAELLNRNESDVMKLSFPKTREKDFPARFWYFGIVSTLQCHLLLFVFSVDDNEENEA